MGQVKTMQGGGEDLILQLRPSPLLSLGVTQGYITQLIFFLFFYWMYFFEQKCCWIKIPSYTPHACRKI